MATNQATFLFFFYLFLLLFKASLMDDVNNLTMLETPIPPRIETAGAKTSKSLTITPKKIKSCKSNFTSKIYCKNTK